jgi:hypothetical protein
MHPLTPNLTELSMEELQSKYNELTKKISQCQRMGNSTLMNQLFMLIEDYRAEIAVRNQKIYDDINKNPNFKNIIDIN